MSTSGIPKTGKGAYGEIAASSAGDGCFDTAARIETPSGSPKTRKTKSCFVCANSGGPPITFKSASQYTEHCAGSKHLANVKRNERKSSITSHRRPAREYLTSAVVPEFFKDLAPAREKDDHHMQATDDGNSWKTSTRNSSVAPGSADPVMTSKQTLELVLCKLQELGGETLLGTLGEALDFSEFEVADAKQYMKTNFGGLLPFCTTQPRHFSILTRGFNTEVNPTIRLAVAPRSPGSGPSQLVAATSRTAASSSQWDFPTLTQANFIAPLLNSEGQVPSWARTVVEDVDDKQAKYVPIRQRGKTAAQAVSASCAILVPTKLAPPRPPRDTQSGPDLCCICTELEADRETDTCQHGYCEECISQWRALRKGDAREFMCCYCQRSYARIIPRSKWFAASV
jgi:hypothetical protein